MSGFKKVQIRKVSENNGDIPVGKADTLGQVNTSAKLADFMVGLLKDSVKNESRVLDPCIGPNTFFNAFIRKGLDCIFTGVELDENILTEEIKAFFDKPHRRLIEGSFFDLSLKNKFDIIIQNPPYVRHELLVDGANSKSFIEQKWNKSSMTIPAQSNLYVYFILKSIDHLLKNGTMICVIYDSWLYSKYGQYIKNILLEYGTIEEVFHFKRSAFENAYVGATVIRFIKSKDNNRKILYYSFNETDEIISADEMDSHHTEIDTLDFIDFRANRECCIDFSSELFTSIGAISKNSNKRGVTALAN